MKRLEAVLSAVCGDVLADIGTDHAMVPIWACLDKKCMYGIACDISQGPLDAALANIKKHNLESRITTRIGNGLAPVLEGEADCIVIAGMGGMNILGILKEGENVARAVKSLILQPQHDICHLRKELHKNYYEIYDELLAYENKLYYHIICARPSSKKDAWPEADYHTGKYEKERDSKLWREYARHETAILEKNIKCIEASKKPGEAGIIKMRELKELIGYFK